jgi:lysozyme
MTKGIFSNQHFSNMLQTLELPETDVLTQAATFIQSLEGFARYRYQCPAKKWTIGYGHVIQPFDRFQEPLSQTEAKDLLIRDLAVMKRHLDKMVSVPLSVLQEIALLSFIFNVGPAAFFRSTLRQKLNRGLQLEVIAEFPRWKWGGGRILPGLVKRRALEADLFEAGFLDMEEEAVITEEVIQ